MYLMTCTRPDLTYPLSLLARYVAPSRHRKVHWDAAKRVLRYLSSTSGMGLVLGGQGPVVLAGHHVEMHPSCWKTKKPVSLHQVHSMARPFLESTVPAEYQKGLIPLLMFAAFLRYSDLISLQWNDIQFEGAAMWLLIPYSKTDQEGKGTWIPIAASAGPYCAVRCTREFIRIAGLTNMPHGPLIRVFNKRAQASPHDKSPSYQTIRSWCLEACRKAGLDATHIGTHSFRKGAATAAAALGIPNRLFKRMGRWRSDGAKDLYVTIAQDQLIDLSTQLQDTSAAPSPARHPQSLERHRRPKMRLPQKTPLE
ncbi:unnamed protein product [Closterium sp. NIES-53]